MTVSRRKFLGYGSAGAMGMAAGLGISGAEGAAESGHPAEDRGDVRRAGLAGTLIGNVHGLLPGAIAFVREGRAGVVLDVGADGLGRPGSTAPDFSWGSWKLQAGESEVEVEWGRVGDAAAFRLRGKAGVTVRMRVPGNAWRAFFHEARAAADGLDVDAVTFDGEYVGWKLRVENGGLVSSAGGNEAEVVVRVGQAGAVRFVAGFGGLPELGAVDGLLDGARARYAAGRAQASGAWGDFAGAIADNLNNNRLYSSLTKRMGNLIGRSGWLVKDADFLPYFTWDSSFNGLLASLEDRETAEETIRTVLRYQLADGMISQITEWPTGTGAWVNTANSNPPVTSLCVWKMWERWGNREFLAEVYPRLLRWHDWWPKHSDGNGNGLLEWGSKVDFRLARLACGWDDTPHFDGAEFVRGQMTGDAVDLNALWSMDAEVLARIAQVLGLGADAERLEQEHREMNRRMNDVLWNEELGLYCSRLWGEGTKPGRFLTRITPMNFYPLICGAADEERGRRVMKTLTDAGKFWGEWPIPTLPYDDVEYAKQDYWKGHVWGPVNYLVWQGVKRYGTAAQQAEFARKSVALFMRNWKRDGSCHENYRSTDGSGDDHPHYTWGALLCQIGLEALVEVGADGKPRGVGNGALHEELELRNVPVGGRMYRVSHRDGRTTVAAEGK